jgi:hypothetical protein
MMVRPMFAERPDHWVLPLRGRVVHRCCVDFGVALESLQPEPRAVLRVHSHFRLEGGDGVAHVVDVESERESAGPLLRLVGRTIERAAATKAGALAVVFDDGSRLAVDPDEEYEGWQLVEDTGFKAIQVPQQGVVIWRGEH